MRESNPEAQHCSQLKVALCNIGHAYITLDLVMWWKWTALRDCGIWQMTYNASYHSDRNHLELVIRKDMMNRGSQFKKKNQPSYLLEKLDIMNDIHWEFTSIHFITGTHMPRILSKQYAEQSKQCFSLLRLQTALLIHLSQGGGALA